MPRAPSDLFNNTTSVANDGEDIGQREMESRSFVEYMTRPPFPVAESSAFSMALSQPAINFSGPMQTSIGGTNIDQSSQVSFPDLVRTGDRTQLWQRPFATVPFLGRGKVDPDSESSIRFGYQDSVGSRPSVAQLSEQSYEGYRITPLIPSKEASVTNPVYLVEEVADSRWTRGGRSTRDESRDKDYD